MDPAMKFVLEEQQKVISTLMDQVNSLRSAPAKSAVHIPHLSTKSLWELSVAYNHPEWVVRMLWLLRSFVLRQPLQISSMRMAEKWSEES